MPIIDLVDNGPKPVLEAVVTVTTKNFATIIALNANGIATGSAEVSSSATKYKTIRGTIKAGAKIEAYNFPNRNIRQDIFEYLPKYYEDSLEAHSIIYTTSNEFIRFNALVYDVLAQFYPETTTWGLERWERVFKIDVDYSQSIERRREEVIERIRGFYEVTLEILQREANKFWLCNIKHDPKELTLTIKILDKNIVATSEPDKMRRFRTKMTALVPCHMELIFAYTVTTWGELKDTKTTWGEVGNYSWKILENVKLN